MNQQQNSKHEERMRRANMFLFGSLAHPETPFLAQFLDELERCEKKKSKSKKKEGK